MTSASKQTGKGILHPETVRVAGQRQQTTKIARRHRKQLEVSNKLTNNGEKLISAPEQVNNRLGAQANSVERIVKEGSGKEFMKGGQEQWSTMASMPKKQFKAANKELNSMMNTTGKYLKPENVVPYTKRVR